MSSRIPSLDKLIHELCRFPGVGPKTAERLAYFILRSKKQDVKELTKALEQIKEFVKHCKKCFAFTENQDFCHYCLDDTRINSLLCIVEEPSDVRRVDASGVFRGRYHVLHGVLSPLDGVFPQDIEVSSLLTRIRKDQEKEACIKEIILALDADIEGDTTALYLAKQLGKFKNIKVTRIAHGVPIGGDIDYVDHRTLGRALENRVLFECH